MELKTKFNFGGNDLAIEEREYIEEKIKKMKKLLPSGKEKETLVEVEIKKDKKGFWEIDFLLDDSYELFRATENNQSLMDAMDQIEESIKKQLKKNKGKMTDLRRRGRREMKEEIVMSDQARA